MADVCPYLVHTPRPKPELKEKPKACSRCGSRHYSPVAQAFCDARDEFDRQMQSWNPEGSKQSIWANADMDRRYRMMNWPWVAGEIFERDKWRCQDCGLKTTVRHLKHSNGEEYLYHETYLRILHGPNRLGNPEDETIQFEVHHIIPRGMGGSDHPANLKLVCQNCHKKYNEKFNSQIISKKAKERKTRKVKEMMPKSLEEFA